MATRIVDVGPCQKEIEVTVPPEKVKDALDRSYGELRNQVALPGFRPGRVPRTVLEKRFGTQVRHEVLHDLMRESIADALKEHALDPVSDPELKGHEEGSEEHHLPEEGPLSFAFTVEVKPEFELPAYKGVEVSRQVAPVTDEQVEEALQELAKDHGEWRPAADETWQAKDLVLGTLTLRAADKAILENEDVQFFVHDPEPRRGIEIQDAEQLVRGRKLGDAVPVVARLLDTYEDEALRGQAAHGTFTLSELKRHTVPPIGEDLARESGHENLEALRASVRQRLEAANRAESDRQVVDKVIDALLSRTEIPLAKGPTERMTKRRQLELAREMIEADPASENAAIEKIQSQEAEIRAKVERDSRAWLLLERIAKKEKIFCLEEDVDRELMRMSSQIGVAPSKLREAYESRGILPELRATIVERKTCDFLRENARISDEKPEAAASTPGPTTKAEGA
jgi:trigger factor